MSLVAYGDSDDSETSDVEEPESSLPTTAAEISDHDHADSGKISDEDDDYVPTSTSSAIHGNQRAAVPSTPEGSSTSPVSAPSSFSDLPAPKTISTTQEGGRGEGEDELEEEVKAKPSQLADAPKPPPKKGKQPARIVLPALRKDSDDEDEEGGKKLKAANNTGVSGSKSGLFSLLPPPTHTSRKQTNRPLIPYTLTKRPTASKPPTTTTPKPSPSTTSSTTPDLDLPSQKRQSAFNALTGYESDSDEENMDTGGSNFFSIDGETDDSKPSSSGLAVKNSAPSISGTETSNESSIPSKDVNIPSSLSSSQSKETSVSSSSQISSSTSNASASTSLAAKTSQDVAANDDDNDDDDDNDNENSDEVSSTVGIPLGDQDAPLSFSNSGAQSSSWLTSPLTAPRVPEMYAGGVNHGASSYWQTHEHYAQDYAVDQTQEEASSSSADGSGIQSYMEDEQFLRISGKRKRGVEDIQIIDANVDDYVDPSDLMKGISEESSYQPHRKKDNMPTNQQKRKKQITYLAFQAKERELELKNAWSQNRMTKNMARSKYGF